MAGVSLVKYDPANICKDRLMRRMRKSMHALSRGDQEDICTCAKSPGRDPGEGFPLERHPHLLTIIV